MVSAVVGLSVLLHVVAIEAQQQRMMQQRPTPQPYTGKGTIDAVARGMVKMSSGAEAVVIQFAPNASVRVLGTAQPDFLRPQMMVQFNATLDKKTGHIEGDVKKLTICTAGPEFTPGCMPETGAGGDSAAAGIGTAAAAKPARKSRGAGKEEPGPHPYIVTGSVTKVNKADSGYKVTVRVPTVKRPVDVTLAEGTQLDVNIADTSLIKQGDSIEVVQGRGIKSQMGTMVMATEAHITLSAPLTGASKKGHAKAGHAKKTEEGSAEFPGAAKPDAKDAKPKDDNK
jgi:hypothetical protein